MIGGESLRQICLEQGMPSVSTVLYWRHTKPNFAAAYDAAREARAEALFEELFDIADDSTNDWMEKELQSGRIIEVPNNEVLRRSELRINTRKWALTQMSPKRYGDKSQIDLKSSDGSMSPASMSDEDKAARIQAIYQNAAKRKAASEKPPADDLDGSDLV